MIKNPKRYQEFQNEQIAKENLTFQESLRIFESLFQEAKQLGIIRRDNILEGIETDIKIARALNRRT